MKKYTLIALFLGFSMAGFFQTANAQRFEKIRTTIPFKFSIADETFEAGKYTIYKIKSVSKPQLFQLVDENNKVLKHFIAYSDYDLAGKRNARVSLVFKHNGENRFLSSMDAYSNSFSFEVRQKSVEGANQKKSRTKKSIDNL